MNNAFKIPLTGLYAAFLAATILPSLASGAVCENVFSNAVGTTGGELKLDNQARLENTGNHVLATDDLSVSGSGAKNACDNARCTASGTPAPTLTLPSNSSTTSYDSNPLSFPAGDYYFKDFTLSGGKGTQLIVTSGTVRIHVSGKLVIDNAKANFQGNAEDLVFLVGGDVDLKDKAKIKAIVYSEGKVVISGSATQLEGAVVGNSIEVTNKARVKYNAAAVDAADLDGICTVGTVPADADGFNCVATSGDALTGHLYLQKVDTPFTFDVVALLDSDNDGVPDGVKTDFATDANRSVTVELVDTSGGGTCATLPVLSPPVNQVMTFTSGDPGRKAASSMLISKAYRSVGCRVTDTTADPDVIACSTDIFAIRPSALTLAPAALNNGGSVGLPKSVAGSFFSLSAVGGAGYSGTPRVDHSRISAHPGASRVGSLTGSFNSADFATGTATGVGFAYSEVGNFRFAAEGLYDDVFAAADAANGDCTNDFSNSPIGGMYGCKFGNTTDTAWIGRFHPAEFTVQTLAPGTLGNTCGAAGFSYQGEEVALSSSTAFRVTARNSGNVTTQNYTGSYAKLDTADFVLAAITADGAQLGKDGVNRVTASWTTAGTRNLADNGDGTLDLVVSNAGFTWGRGGNDLVAPFLTDLDISLVSVSDNDAVAATGLPETATPAGVNMRFGRVRLANAHGSELQHLSVPMQVEYYSGIGSGFQANAADSCTIVSGIVFADLNVSDGLETTDTCVWDQDNDSGNGCAGTGPSGVEFEPSPVAGSFDLSLKSPGVGNTGVIEVRADVPSHLEYEWKGTGDVDPSARATFGIFNRPSTVIFRRELR